MKKILALILVLAVFAAVSCAYADNYYIWFSNNNWHSNDSSGTAYQDIPPKYKDYMVNYNFPVSVIQDVSYLCDRYHATPIGWLGLVSDKGINLRTAPNIGNSYRGIQLHADTTVYIYFSFIDNTNREWYYATTVEGTCGFLRSNFIKLIPFTK